MNTLSAHELLNRFKMHTRTLRGRRVALETDVAALYEISTEYLRRVIGRHRVRFPPDVLFRISEMEHQTLGRGKAGVSISYVFTEEGVLLLSSVLKTPRAVQVSVEIIRELFGFRLN